MTISIFSSWSPLGFLKADLNSPRILQNMALNPVGLGERGVSGDAVSLSSGAKLNKVSDSHSSGKVTCTVCFRLTFLLGDQGDYLATSKSEWL